MSKLFDILNKYNKNNVFVETGTYMGYGVNQALQTNMFNKIHSIEIAKHLYEKNILIFKNIDHVHLHLGDSADCLTNIINTYNEGITFWLDAHASGGITGSSNDYLSPIQQELNIIKNSKHTDKHIIIIDDMADFTQEKIDLNKINNVGIDPGYICQDRLLNILKDINKNYKISLVAGSNGGQLIATPYD